MAVIRFLFLRLRNGRCSAWNLMVRRYDGYTCQTYASDTEIEGSYLEPAVESRWRCRDFNDDMTYDDGILYALHFL